MRRWVLLIVLGAALSGCKYLDRDRDKPPRAAAEPASRTKTDPKGGKGWLDGPSPGLGEVGTPPADSWADPKTPGYDVSREMRGVLGGFVEDPDGRKVRDVFIEVELVGDTGGGGAPVGVQTDRQGYFLIRGLKPKQTYQLTARTRLDNRELCGRAFAQTSAERSLYTRITLIEGLSFPGGSAGGSSTLPAPPGGPSPAPGAAIPPPPVLPSGTGEPPPPLSRDREGTGLPLPLPSAADRVPDLPREPAVSPRPDLMTKDPDPGFRPPATNIPPPGVTPPSTAPIPSPPSPPPASGTGRSSRSVKPGAAFALVDTMGVSREFPSGRDGELVLLDFMTTTCVPCKRALPTLRNLQTKYGLRGAELIGVTCDEAQLPQRRALAAAYHRAERLNYLLYTEPSSRPGQLRDRFGVEGYPTLVLLAGSGEVLWKGHPNDVAELERVIESELANRPQ